MKFFGKLPRPLIWFIVSVLLFPSFLLLINEINLQYQSLNITENWQIINTSEINYDKKNANANIFQVIKNIDFGNKKPVRVRKTLTIPEKWKNQTIVIYLSPIKFANIKLYYNLDDIKQIELSKINFNGKKNIFLIPQDLVNTGPNNLSIQITKNNRYKPFFTGSNIILVPYKWLKNYMNLRSYTIAVIFFGILFLLILTLINHKIQKINLDRNEYNIGLQSSTLYYFFTTIIYILIIFFYHYSNNFNSFPGIILLFSGIIVNYNLMSLTITKYYFNDRIPKQHIIYIKKSRLLYAVIFISLFIILALFKKVHTGLYFLYIYLFLDLIYFLIHLIIGSLHAKFKFFPIILSILLLLIYSTVHDFASVIAINKSALILPINILLICLIFIINNSLDNISLILKNNRVTNELKDFNEWLVQDLQRRTDELEKKDKEMMNELNIAGKIQNGIIPHKLISWDAIHFNLLYQPMTQVSGDFYDIYRSSHQMVIVLLDVCGHGVPAALITMAAKQSLNSLFYKELPLNNIFTKFNSDLFATLKSFEFITGFLIRIDRKNKVTYANAGHRRAILHRKKDNSIEFLDTEGFFIGIQEELNQYYEEKETQLYPGDKIYLYTDGIIETRSPDQVEFGEKKLIQFIIDNHELSRTEFLEKLKYTLQDFSQKKHFTDDLTMLIIELDKNYYEFLDLFQTGTILSNQNKNQEALETLKNAEELLPTYPDLIMNIAEIYNKIENFEQAAMYYEKCTSIFRNDVNLLYTLARTYFNADKKDKAIEYLKISIKLNPLYEQSINLLANIYEGKGDFKLAIKYYTKIFELNPQDQYVRDKIKELHKKKNLVK